MQEPLDALENRIAELRRAVRGALADRDQERVRELRSELRRAERSWDALVTPPERPEEDRQGLASLLPVREQVHQSLTLIGVAAAPKLVSAVHSAFFGGPLAPTGLASLRRDEERSYRSAPAARPYYLCPALTSDLLSPARALACISIWPLEQRIIGPLSPRVDFLTAAVRIADATAALFNAGAASAEAERLLRRFAVNIPGAGPARPGEAVSPAAAAAAAAAELAIHADRDRDDRTNAAQRARHQLGDADQLFGVRLTTVPDTGTAG
ncbi:hypothetical protein EAS64_10460 [Trebonia kvetii]|uniref:Uncharacterized protein n=1 Tax=Trebonia kvetii TaxID=2480626 RepID=A0A6P2C0Z5_9ACTN|nr:hypothetical protein [Trebonia kvetii]TVZ05034.1 hypothetical protein EAS64_10460 [Trebonia kvetii]